jgi:hypothetical protein
MKTQNQQIEQHLLKGKKINPLQALNKFGCFRLSARIKDLRDNGMNIKTTYTTVGNKTFATYNKC